MFKSVKSLVLLTAAVIVTTPALAGPYGTRQQVPANGYASSARVENFEAEKNFEYVNYTKEYAIEDKIVDGHAYGDKVNVLPAKTRVYVYENGPYAPPRVYYRR